MSEMSERAALAMHARYYDTPWDELSDNERDFVLLFLLGVC